MKRFLLYLLALLVLVAAVFGGLRLHQQRRQGLTAVPPPSVAPWALRSAAVIRGRITRGFPALALVKGEREVKVAPRLSAVIEAMGPREGARVHAGDLLARLDTRELEKQLAALEAKLAAAGTDARRKARDARRSRELLREHGISESQADRDEAAAQAAREQITALQREIEAAQVRLGYARITAPVDGVIAARLADPGDLATVGKPLYRLIVVRSGRLEVRLPAEVLERVRPGNEVEVSHDGETLRLHAARIFPALDARSLGYIEIDVPALPFGAAPGALLHARVVTAALDAALQVPADALRPLPGGVQARVFRIRGEGQGGRLDAVTVRILLRTAQRVAVAGPLAPGERVVVAHETTLLRLQDGDRVTLEPAP